MQHVREKKDGCDVGQRSLAVLLRDWLKAVLGCEQRLATDHRQVGLSTTLTVKDTTDLIYPTFRHLFSQRM